MLVLLPRPAIMRPSKRSLRSGSGAAPKTPPGSDEAVAKPAHPTLDLCIEQRWQAAAAAAEAKSERNGKHLPSP